jgi:hypothetical protein
MTKLDFSLDFLALFLVFLFDQCLLVQAPNPGRPTSLIPSDWIVQDSTPPGVSDAIQCKGRPTVLEHNFYLRGARSVLQICADSIRGGGYQLEGHAPRIGYGAKCGTLPYFRRGIIFADPVSLMPEAPSPRFEDLWTRLWCQAKCEW